MHNIVPRLSGTPGVWRRPAPRSASTPTTLPLPWLVPAEIARAARRRGLRMIRSLLYRAGPCPAFRGARA